MRATLRAMVLGVVSAALAGAAHAEPIRVAFGDIASVELLHFLAALERAKERGLDIADDVLQVGGHRRPGSGRRSGRYRGGRPLRTPAEGPGPDPHLLPDEHAQLLPYRRCLALSGLGGSRWGRRRGARARLGHRGDHEADGRAQRHRARPDQLRAGLRGPGRRPAAREHQGQHRRFDRQAAARGAGPRQVQGAADRGCERHRRSTLCRHRLPRGAGARPWRRWSRRC